MNINIVAAFAGESRVIGKDGGMPWHIPADLAHFQRLTTGHPVIMGRKTFASIGKPLHGRTNIVLSKTLEKGAADFVLAHSFAEAVFKASISTGGNEVFVIGGEGVFEEALTKARRLYLTLIDTEVEGDTFFPPYKHLFKRTLSKRTETSNGYAITFQTLVR